MSMTVDLDTDPQADPTYEDTTEKFSCRSGLTTQCLDLGPNGAPEVTEVWQKIFIICVFEKLANNCFLFDLSMHNYIQVQISMRIFMSRNYALYRFPKKRFGCYITIFLLTGLRIYTGEYKAQGPTLCPTEGRALRGPRALCSPV